MTPNNDLLALAEPMIDASGNSNYAPCIIGLHLCGETHGQPYTALNVPARSHAVARAMFAAAKAEAECPEEEADFVCDLNLGDARRGVEHVEDFWTNRQLAARLYGAALKARALAKDPERKGE